MAATQGQIPTNALSKASLSTSGVRKNKNVLTYTVRISYDASKTKYGPDEWTQNGDVCLTE